MNLLLTGSLNLLCALLMGVTIWLNYDYKTHLRRVLEVCILVMCFLIGAHHIGKYLIVDVERVKINPLFDSVGYIIDILAAASTVLSFLDNLITKIKMNHNGTDEIL